MARARANLNRIENFMKNTATVSQCTRVQNFWHRWPVDEVKCLCSRGPPAFQYLILVIWRAYLWFKFGHDISSMASKCHELEIWCLKLLKTGIPNFCHFEASEDIMTKFKSQALNFKRIKCWKAGGSGNPPSLIPSNKVWKRKL